MHKLPGSVADRWLQIPAIAFPDIDKAYGLREPGQSGVTIIVSPLIALMKDQVDVLKRRGIPADCIDSTKTADQLQAINQRLNRGELRMIYCAPERLNNERFVESMKHIPGGVRLVAVDEAHCISEVLPSPPLLVPTSSIVSNSDTDTQQSGVIRSGQSISKVCISPLAYSTKLETDHRSSCPLRRGDQGRTRHLLDRNRYPKGGR